MFLPLLDISVSSITGVRRVPALKFDLGMLSVHMIFEFVQPPEALRALSWTSVGETAMGSWTAFVGLEMAPKVSLPDVSLVTTFNVADVSYALRRPHGSDWSFAIVPVLEDQCLLLIWFHEALVDG